MARGAVKAKQAQSLKNQKAAPRLEAARKAQPHGRKRHASGGNPNQQLFFSRHAPPGEARVPHPRRPLRHHVRLPRRRLGREQRPRPALQRPQHLRQQRLVRLEGAEGGRRSTRPTRRASATSPPRTRRRATRRTRSPRCSSTRRSSRRTRRSWSELAGLQLGQAQDYVTQYQAAAQTQQLAAPSQAFRPDRQARHGARDRPDRAGRGIDREHGDERPLPEGDARVQRRDLVVQVARRSSSRRTRTRSSSSRRPPRPRATRRPRSPPTRPS